MGLPAIPSSANFAYRVFSDALSFFPRVRTSWRNRRRQFELLTNEFRAAGFPHAKFGIAAFFGKGAVKTLTSSFGLTIVENVRKEISFYELIKEISKYDCFLYFLKGGNGSGKTIFALTLALYGPRLFGSVAAYYVGPHNLGQIQGVNYHPDPELKQWISARPNTTKIFILDAINESISKLSLLRHTIKYLSNSEGSWRLMLLSRPMQLGDAPSFEAFVASTFDKSESLYSREIGLSFDPRSAAHTAVYERVLLRGLLRGEARWVLSKYAERFKSFPVTREVATAVLTSYAQGRIAPPEVPPSQLLFDSLIASLKEGNQVNRASMPILFSGLGFSLIKQRRLTGEFSNEFAANAMDISVEDADRVMTSVKDNNRIYKLRVGSADGKHYFLFDETQIHALAALYLARKIASNRQSGKQMREFEALRGNTMFDNCGRFLLPAYKGLLNEFPLEFSSDITIHRETLTAYLDRLIVDENFSFVANVLSNVADNEVLIDDKTRIELIHRLFKRVTDDIDNDRLKTNKEMVKSDERQKSAPILDQLFEVSAQFGDRSIGIFLDALSCKANVTVRSQGAYMLLFWLSHNVRQKPHDIPESKKALIWELISGIGRVQSGNLHINLHIAEILEFLMNIKFRTKPDEETKTILIRNIAQGIPVNQRQRQLYDDNFRHTALGQLPLTELENLYWETFSMLQEFMGAITERSEADWFRADGKVLQLSSLLGILKTMESQIDATYSETARLKDASDDRVLELTLRPYAYPTSANDFFEGTENSFLGWFFEIYETLLALARRFYASPEGRCVDHGQFIEHVNLSKFWLVHWWGYYNAVEALRSYHESQELAQFVANELRCGAEPVGLKVRQANLLLDTLKAYAESNENEFQRIFASRLEDWKISETANDYKAVLNADRGLSYLGDFVHLSARIRKELLLQN